MRRRIHITELAYPCITRRRGHEASEKLKGCLGIEPVEIDLTGVDMLSSSFLDELISRFIGSGDEEKVIFLVDSSTVENKLERVAGIRSVKILRRLGDSDINPVSPKSTTSHKTTFMATKAASR